MQRALLCFALLARFRADTVPIDCVAVTDGARAAESRVSCSDAGADYASYVMIGCGIRSKWQNAGESYNEGLNDATAVLLFDITLQSPAVRSSVSCNPYTHVAQVLNRHLVK